MKSVGKGASANDILSRNSKRHVKEVIRTTFRSSLMSHVIIIIDGRVIQQQIDRTCHRSECPDSAWSLLRRFDGEKYVSFATAIPAPASQSSRASDTTQVLVPGWKQ